MRVQVGGRAQTRSRVRLTSDLSSRHVRYSPIPRRASGPHGRPRLRRRPRGHGAPPPPPPAVARGHHFLSIDDDVFRKPIDSKVAAAARRLPASPPPRPSSDPSHPSRPLNPPPLPQRAAVVRETGPSSVMKVENDYPVPKLAPGGVLVKNKYSGINFIDTYHRSGLYKRELPFIGGQEGGGFVAAVTPEAESQGVKVGDRVAYSSVFQTYAEYTAVPASKVVTVPEEVPLDVAVSCGVQGMTAHYLTHSAHAGLVKPGEWMLIHGTGSGTCQWAAQMAKLRGYKVIGTCSESKQDIARATGVDELIDYTSVDLVPKVMEITGGEGVKAVIDGIGLATWETSIESLARRGIFVSFGNASGAVPAFPPLRLINKSGFITRPKLNDYTVTREELLSRANDIYGWIDKGDLKVVVDRTFPLEQAKEGHDYLEAGRSRGKVLYEI
ncbi:uncharacterized protein MICPUCDRAFT_15288 [Micromonas pusilla CCMP1545]|uniref:Predicted protein n=1 Tax=Micromonas pusilla (strain CCMP1545) TaxID=564608 RepID=C1MLW9_MICPC|nr:uncharacterized protein MICPUCDRAFT_15288 [Micromonas pusilla CCMP1545]EEH58481.1 predicted protein [Micromonas pusilla CCMP1545]|eukprot:XP_003056836.1 predicted protein [Micromonas pusilla CCMP1545]